MRKKIQVVTFNSDIMGAKRLCFVGSDYLKSGWTAAGLMGRFIKESVQVCAVAGSLQMLGHSQRITGFREMLEREHPHLNLAQILESKDDNAISYQTMLEYLKNHPNTRGIYFAAAGVEGGIKAIQELGLEQCITIITCDDTPEICKFIREGIVDATVCQQPFEQGYRPIKILFDCIIGKIMPESDSIFTENLIKIKENL